MYKLGHITPAYNFATAVQLLILATLVGRSDDRLSITSLSSCFILGRNGSSFAQQKKGGAIRGRSASLQEVEVQACSRSRVTIYAVAKAADPKDV